MIFPIKCAKLEILISYAAQNENGFLKSFTRLIAVPTLFAFGSCARSESVWLFHFLCHIYIKGKKGYRGNAIGLVQNNTIWRTAAWFPAVCKTKLMDLKIAVCRSRIEKKKKNHRKKRHGNLKSCSHFTVYAWGKKKLVTTINLLNLARLATSLECLVMRPLILA